MTKEEDELPARLNVRPSFITTKDRVIDHPATAYLQRLVAQSPRLPLHRPHYRSRMAIFTSSARHHARRRFLVLDPELMHDDPRLRNISHSHLEDRGFHHEGSVLDMGFTDCRVPMCPFIAIGIRFWTN